MIGADEPPGGDSPVDSTIDGGTVAGAGVVERLVADVVAGGALVEVEVAADAGGASVLVAGAVVVVEIEAGGVV